MDKTIVRRQVADEDLAKLEQLHPILRRVFASRGVNSTQELEKGLEHLYSYRTLKNIDEAVACLFNALEQQKRILIVGDFDADGATSTAVAIACLRSFGAKHIDYIVPNRFEYGYGLTPEIVHAAQDKQPELIITVDNGISSCAGVEAAKKLGCQVVITDHHLPGNELPNADAIVNPNQKGDEFPSKYLAGVGVIFYVMLALRSYLRHLEWFKQHDLPEPNMAHVLDLVALGTVADVVPLDRNNRILVHQGLNRIRNGYARPGILALLSVAQRKPEGLVASDLGFAVAPRLNAAGRIDDMSIGIECLLCQDYHRALPMAQQLDQLNQERKSIENDMQKQAITVISKLQLNTDETSMPLGLCLFDENWHQGVIGILAGRLKDRFHRPTIAFALASETELKGSARSIPGLHIRDLLDAIASKHPNLIEKFGGHAMAAGLSLNRENFKAFQQAYYDEIAGQLTENELQSVITSDGELDDDDFSVSLAHLLREAGPWGQTFPEPLFDGMFRLVEQRIVGIRHLKMTLALEKSEKLINAIAFNIDLNHWPNHRCERIEAAFRLDINEFRGQRNLQLIVESIREIA